MSEAKALHEWTDPQMGPCKLYEVIRLDDPSLLRYEWKGSIGTTCNPTEDTLAREILRLAAALTAAEDRARRGRGG